jgi:hypothetical protein
MALVYGSFAGRRDNIVELGTLTEIGATNSVEVMGSDFCFVHNATGGNVTVVDEGSLDGTTWFSLDTAKTHSESGVHPQFYPYRIVRFVRSRCTAIGNGDSVTITMATA